MNRGTKLCLCKVKDAIVGLQGWKSQAKFFPVFHLKFVLFPLSLTILVLIKES